MSTAPTLLRRLSDAWMAFRCSGAPITGKMIWITGDGSTAGGLDIRTFEQVPPIWWQCSNLGSECGGCPRFQAYRQGKLAGEHGPLQDDGSSHSEKFKSTLSHGEWKTAQVNGGDGERFFPIGGDPHHPHLDTDTVLQPVAPSVEKTQYCTQNGDSERNGLGKVRLHAMQHSSGGINTAHIWLIATGLAFAIAASCNLDGPEDHAGDWADSQALKALQATQAHSASRQRAAQALCTHARGPNSEARWTPEGDLVCTTRRGLVAQSQ